jgi:hypothetical protein
VLWPRRDPTDEQRARAIASALKTAGAVPILADPVSIALHGESLMDVFEQAHRRTDVIRRLDRTLRPVPAAAPPATGEVDLTVLERIASETLPPTPLHLTPSWASWVVGTSADVATAQDHLFACLLSAPMGLTAGAVAVSPWAGYEEPTLGKFGIVDQSGGGKTQAINAVAGAVRELEAQARARYRDQLAVWELECKVCALRKEPKPPRPISPQFIIGDATPEAIAVRLSQRDVGLWKVIPEGAAAVHNLSRYSGGSLAVTGALAQELQDFDGEYTSVARRNLGDDPLHLRLATSTLSGFQPDVVSMMLDLDRKLQVGLMARWVMVFPDPVIVPPPRPQDADAPLVQARREQWKRAAQRLIDFGEAAAADVAANRRRVIKLTAPAADRFDAWRIRWREFIYRASGGAPTGWDAKGPGWVLRIAGAGGMLEWAAGDAPINAELVIDLPMIEAAIETRAQWLRAHRRRVEADSEAPTPERLAATLGRWVVATGAAVVDTVALRRRIRLPGLRSDAAVLSALTELQAAGFVGAGFGLPQDLRREPMPRLVPMNQKAIALARDKCGLHALPEPPQ